MKRHTTLSHTTLSLLCALVAFGLLSGTASASSVSWEALQFTNPAFSLSGLDNVSLSGVTSGNYTITSAEWCENASCDSPISATEDSLLRFTNLSLTCNGAEGCSGITFTFEADTALLFSSASAAVDLGINGFTNGGSNVTGTAGFCISTNSFLCSSALSGTQSFSTSFVIGPTGALGGESGVATIDPGSNIYGEFDIDSMQFNQTLTLPGSMDIGTTFLLGSTAAPEPATLSELAIGAFALIGAASLRKRRKS